MPWVTNLISQGLHVSDCWSIEGIVYARTGRFQRRDLIIEEAILREESSCLENAALVCQIVLLCKIINVFEEFGVVHAAQDIISIRGPPVIFSIKSISKRSADSYALTFDCGHCCLVFGAPAWSFKVNEVESHLISMNFSHRSIVLGGLPLLRRESLILSKVQDAGYAI